ncbi:hypothetical protein [Micromonospora mirobrigensis]|uniref:Peptidase MA superfamily n=1 Tax=Micromonospora mirobrigensis TaxID=262898 RepID=A0A1C4VUQ2_9ACTN|nr:hypothetical protein [Micromonospora mirobrigensis]SCE87726.1 Peptidase MA superfamily [Micromonospora mirobrigensis]
MTEGHPSVPSPRAGGPGQPVPTPVGPPATSGTASPGLPPAPVVPLPGQYAPPGQYPPPPPGPQVGPYPPQGGPYGPPAHGPAYGPPGQPGGPAPFGPYGAYPPPVVPPPAKRSRRWLWISLGAVALVLALCAGTLVVVKSTLDASNAASAAELDEKYNPIKLEEVEALLDAHGQALRKADLKAFLAPFDPANKALVAQQTRLFRNLVKVPFAEERFERVHQTDFKRAGERVAFDVTISFVHRFETFDRAAVEELYRWTVVRPAKGAPLVVTRTGGLPVDRNRDRFTYYPAPWDKWPTLHVERTPHTIILVDSSLAALAKRYAPDAERAAVADLTTWRSGGVPGEIPQGFVLSLVKGKKELGSLYRYTKKLPDEAGVSIPVPPAGRIDTGGEGAGPDTGGSRVVIDVAERYFFDNGPDLRGTIFRHEFAHSLVFNLYEHDPKKYFAEDELANWVVEGFAEWMGHQRKPWTASDRAAEGRRMLRSLDYDLPMPENYSWNMAGRVSYHYWLGNSAIGYIAEKYGQSKVFELVATHYRGKDIRVATQQVLEVPYQTFCDQWAAYVKGRVR